MLFSNRHLNVWVHLVQELGLFDWSVTEYKHFGVPSSFSLFQVLVGLQLETGCNYQLLDTSKDLSDLVKTFTKAVAEAPLKYVLTGYVVLE